VKTEEAKVIITIWDVPYKNDFKVIVGGSKMYKKDGESIVDGIYKGNDKTIVHETISALLEYELEALNQFLDEVYARFGREYKLILADAVCEIEEKSEKEYSQVEAKLSQMGKFKPRRFRSMIEYSDEELKEQSV